MDPQLFKTSTAAGTAEAQYDLAVGYPCAPKFAAARAASTGAYVCTGPDDVEKFVSAYNRVFNSVARLLEARPHVKRMLGSSNRA